MGYTPAAGHEPEGSTAGDHIWGVTVFMAIPETDVVMEYGAIDGQENWIWTGGQNGTVTIP